MASDYDQQLLESVAVRRQRMVAALLFGHNRLRRSFSDGLRRTMAGVVVAALLAAGCVGYSFVRKAMHEARLQDQQRQSSYQQAPAPTPAEQSDDGTTGEEDQP